LNVLLKQYLIKIESIQTKKNNVQYSSYKLVILADILDIIKNKHERNKLTLYNKPLIIKNSELLEKINNHEYCYWLDYLNFGSEENNNEFLFEDDNDDE
jgi:hypothetical protein